MGAVGGLQLYPMPAATHAEVCQDADRFMQTLRELHQQLDLFMPKITKLGGNELDLHLLYTQVTALGGAETVIRMKQWRDVGDAFKLPSTITSVSYVLKKAFMVFLWDYEQVYFHGKGGQPRVPPPASKPSRESADATGLHSLYVPHARHLTHCHVPNALDGVHPYDPAAAAAMASAHLRAQQDWAMAAMQHAQTAQAGAPRPEGAPASSTGALMPGFPPPPFPAVPGFPAVTPPPWTASMHLGVPPPNLPQSDGLVAADAPDTLHAQSRAGDSGGTLSSMLPPSDTTPSASFANLSLTAIAAGVGTPTPALVGEQGSITVRSMFDHGYFVTVQLAGQEFCGMLAYPPLSASSAHAQPHGLRAVKPDAGGPPHKRSRAENVVLGEQPLHEPAPQLAASNSAAVPKLPKLPETIFSLLMKHNATHGGGEMLSSEHAASLWAMMPPSARKLLEGAVETDQLRFQAEQAAYHRQLEASNVTMLASEKLQDAERVMSQLCISSSKGMPPEGEPAPETVNSLHYARVPPHLYRCNALAGAATAQTSQDSAALPNPSTTSSSGAAGGGGQPNGAAAGVDGVISNLSSVTSLGAVATVYNAYQAQALNVNAQPQPSQQQQPMPGSTAGVATPVLPAACQPAVWPFDGPAPFPASGAPPTSAAPSSRAEHANGPSLEHPRSSLSAAIELSGLSGSGAPGLLNDTPSRAHGRGLDAQASGDGVAAMDHDALPPLPHGAANAEGERRVDGALAAAADASALERGLSAFDDGSPFWLPSPGGKTGPGRLAGESSSLGGPSSTPNAVMGRPLDPARHLAYPQVAASDSEPRSLNILQKAPQAWDTAGLWGGASLSLSGIDFAANDLSICMDKDEERFLDDLMGQDNDWEPPRPDTEMIRES